MLNQAFISRPFDHREVVNCIAALLCVQQACWMEAGNMNLQTDDDDEHLSLHDRHVLQIKVELTSASFTTSVSWSSLTLSRSMCVSLAVARMC